MDATKINIVIDEVKRTVWCNGWLGLALHLPNGWTKELLPPLFCREMKVAVLLRDSGLMYKDKKISGIKLIRQLTRCDLKEAKDAFEVVFALSEEDFRKVNDRVLQELYAADAKPIAEQLPI